MKIELYPVEELIKRNNIPEVTNPIIFDMGTKPTDDGLLSRQIFGNSSYERKNTFGYINLNGHFLSPYIYKLIKRLDRNIDHIIFGTKYYVIKNNYFVEDEENGDTGLEWLYKNWDQIKFKRNDSSIRNERIDILSYYDKDTIFQRFAIVSPPFYRDVNSSDAGSGKVRPHEMTKLYSNLLSYAKSLKNTTEFDFKLNNTRGLMQNLLVEIYNKYKILLEKKNGLIRKNLLGKSVTYGARSVITAPIFNANRPEDCEIDFDHAGIPLAQACAMQTPFIVAWVKRFFETELEKMGSKYPVKTKEGKIVFYKLKKPETYFNDQFIKKQLKRFVRSSADRFEKVELPLEEGQTDKKVYLTFAGRYYEEGKPETESEIFKRPATWTDIFYQAAYEVSQGHIAWITRYPIMDIFGTFPNKITVLSTKETKPIYIGSTLYKNYPVIDLSLSKHDVDMVFRDTVTMSNLFLLGLNGDYDGDQVSIRITFSQQANQEGERIINSKHMLIGFQGQNIRTSSNECIQSLYHLTS